MELIHALESQGASRCIVWTDAPSGLRAVLVIDDVTLGPAAGGVRTQRYPGLLAATLEAAALARAMTIKCALAGLDAGGGKAVVMLHPGLSRRDAFVALGARIEELGGLFRTAGDLGTTGEDLAAMATATRYVHTDESNLSLAVARGLRRCMEACASMRGREGLAGLRIAIQGCGSIGGAAARELADAGATIFVADVDAGRAMRVADAVGGRVLEPSAVLTADVDIVAPCATGGVVTEEVVPNLRAWAVCGAANNILASPSAGALLAERDVLFVPDVIASAGAVIHGIGATVMGLADRGPLIDALGTTARAVLEGARQERRTPTQVAESLARERIDARARARLAQ